MRLSTLLLLVAAASAAWGDDDLPVIDMHLHALGWGLLTRCEYTLLGLFC